MVGSNGADIQVVDKLGNSLYHRFILWGFNSTGLIDIVRNGSNIKLR